MKRATFSFLTAALGIAALAFQLTTAAHGQEKAKAKGGKAKAATPTGPAPRLADGTPDLSGLWSGGGTGNMMRLLKPGDTIKMTPAAQKLFESRKSAEDPEANCLPAGVPRMPPYPWRVLQTPTHYYILFEGNIHSYRQIFMDGRGHPADPDPTWYGHSIGKWEGDSLVVDTVGYNDRFWFDFDGHPHTEQLHTIERFTRPDLGTLRWDITIEDPGAYEKPFTLNTQARLIGGDLMEYICQENNTNVEHIQGPARTP